MAMALWLLSYGYGPMATALWLWPYGYVPTAACLWLYGYGSMVTAPWLWPHGYGPMAVAPLRLWPYGYGLMAMALWLWPYGYGPMAMPVELLSKKQNMCRSERTYPWSRAMGPYPWIHIHGAVSIEPHLWSHMYGRCPESHAQREPGPQGHAQRAMVIEP